MAVKLSKEQRAQLKSLTREPGWDVLIILMDDIQTTIARTPISGTNAFEELRMLHTNSGKVEGVKLILDEAERLANE